MHTQAACFYFTLLSQQLKLQRRTACCSWDTEAPSSIQPDPHLNKSLPHFVLLVRPAPWGEHIHGGVLYWRYAVYWQRVIPFVLAASWNSLVTLGGACCPWTIFTRRLPLGAFFNLHWSTYKLQGLGHQWNDAWTIRVGQYCLCFITHVLMLDWALV